MAAALTAVVTLAVVFMAAGPASALTTNSNELARTLQADGRIVEVDQSPELNAAIDRANDAGVVVAVLDQDSEGGEASDLAETLNLELDSVGSSYDTVLVITNNGYGANSWTASDAELSLALDEAFDGISTGDLAGGVDAFVETLPTETPESPSGGGFGFGRILAAGGILGAVFLFFRRLTRGRKDRALAEKQLELDRAEIVEQLRSNADRVISLGDRVIISENAELIALYEEASATYQAVSGEVESASTPEAVDALDDRIDKAEWQLAVIEAELDGKPRPARPVETIDPPNGPPTGPSKQSIPAPRPDLQDARREQTRQPPPRQPVDYRSRRTGSSGGLGGVLGSILGNIVISGGGLGGTQSRRTQRRTGSGFPSGSGFGFPSSGGSSRSSRSTSRRRGSSGGSSRSSRSTSRRRGSSGGRTTRRRSSGRRRSSKGGRSF